MRANPYAATNRSGGTSGWSGSALMVPGGISDGLAKLGEALVNAPIARRRLEQQALLQQSQQDRQARQDSLAHALGLAQMDNYKTLGEDRKSQQDARASKSALDWTTALATGAENLAGDFGYGRKAKGEATPARTEGRPLDDAAALRIALETTKANAKGGPVSMEDVLANFGKIKGHGATKGAPVAPDSGVGGALPPVAGADQARQFAALQQALTNFKPYSDPSQAPSRPIGQPPLSSGPLSGLSAPAPAPAAPAGPLGQVLGGAPAPMAPAPVAAPPAMAAPAAPAPVAPSPGGPNGKVIPASSLKLKADQHFGGDVQAAADHARSLGYAIDPSM